MLDMTNALLSAVRMEVLGVCAVLVGLLVLLWLVSKDDEM